MSDQENNDPVLSDDEKDALLDGMSNGEVEVQTGNGSQYADVREFDIGPRSRIVSLSYPRLQTVNQQFANRFGKQVEQMLNAETEIAFDHLDSCTFSDFCERASGLTLLYEFTAEPLEGSAFVHLDAQMVGHVVETFFGGTGNDSGREAESYFTAGEVSVANRFGGALVESLADVWQSLMDITTVHSTTHQGPDAIENVDAGDGVIASRFRVTIEGREESFDIVWPLATVAPLVPVFEGQKRERDPDEDARWGKALRERVTNSTINLSSRVGRTRMTLGEVAELRPGAVIDISNPQRGTVFANDIAVLEGRFGVHDGRYAIEAGNWLEKETGNG
ncbi:MAG: FliM/FliN family flagellar motor switch protein [Woeseiaceae bacterium]|nr:FliM/FliN family flagellar motor switch protein [Woeseiaceae bacterium]